MSELLCLLHKWHCAYIIIGIDTSFMNILSLIELIVYLLGTIIVCFAFIKSGKSKKEPTREDYNRLRMISFVYIMLFLVSGILNIIKEYC